MKLVVTGDWHLDATTGGVARREEVKRAVMDGPVRAAVEGQADLFCFVGDLCDPGSRLAVSDVAFPVQVALHLAAERVRSVWVAGNHDVVLSRDVATTLDAIDAAGNAYAHVSRRWEFVSRPWNPRLCGVSLVLLPYEAYPSQGFAGPNFDGPYLAFGHCTTFAGTVREGSESAEFARGRGQAWPSSVADRALFSANGHFHDPQDVELASGARVHVPGSLVRLTFGDAERDRGFSIVEVRV